MKKANQKNKKKGMSPEQMQQNKRHNKENRWVLTFGICILVLFTLYALASICLLAFSQEVDPITQGDTSLFLALITSVWTNIIFYILDNNYNLSKNKKVIYNIIGISSVILISYLLINGKIIPLYLTEPIQYIFQNILNAMIGIAAGALSNVLSISLSLLNTSERKRRRSQKS